MYKHILIAADGSEHSQRAAKNAVQIAQCNPDANIEIVYVFDPNKAKSEALNHWDVEYVGDQRKRRIKSVEEIVSRSGVSYETTVLNGEPRHMLVDYANRNEVDLVVIGSRGLNVLQEMVLGSVSHKVAKRANCPVLIVK
ncbi:MAG TPA: universal stress protein [Bacillota bacterium]|nr:universal stress protein [Bacillota bacterium]